MSRTDPLSATFAALADPTRRAILAAAAAPAQGPPPGPEPERQWQVRHLRLAAAVGVCLPTFLAGPARGEPTGDDQP
ncbi:hypothetical protein AB0B45_04655 [Nonomuraea sp. NPDC049152]|uniref:hypothetical protein n=1 Tax=Nonomuraea sp. NPDC049152 TaxID=3154350 RepID=UPI00340726A7